MDYVDIHEALRRSDELVFQAMKALKAHEQSEAMPCKESPAPSKGLRRRVMRADL